jgi:hypothetical protein
MGGGLRRLEEKDKLDFDLIADIYTFDPWLMVAADGLAHPAMPYVARERNRIHWSGFWTGAHSFVMLRGRV